MFLEGEIIRESKSYSGGSVLRVASPVSALMKIMML